MSDKRDEDGFVYHADRTVRKGGRIKIDNTWYQHEDLERFIGQTVFVYNTGSYWKTECTVYPYWAHFDNKRIICVLK